MIAAMKNGLRDISKIRMNYLKRTFEFSSLRVNNLVWSFTAVDLIASSRLIGRGDADWVHHS
jgi:hypothetical protein